MSGGRKVSIRVRNRLHSSLGAQLSTGYFPSSHAAELAACIDYPHGRAAPIYLTRQSFVRGQTACAPALGLQAVEASDSGARDWRNNDLFGSRVEWER